MHGRKSPESIAPGHRGSVIMVELHVDHEGLVILAIYPFILFGICCKNSTTPIQVLSYNIVWRVSHISINPSIYETLSLATILLCFQKLFHGPLVTYIKLRVRMRRECREMFSPPPTSKEIANPQWQKKLSRHSRCMCNPQFYISGKRPIVTRCNWPINTTDALFTNARD